MCGEGERECNLCRLEIEAAQKKTNESKREKEGEGEQQQQKRKNMRHVTNQKDDPGCLELDPHDGEHARKNGAQGPQERVQGLCGALHDSLPGQGPGHTGMGEKERERENAAATAQRTTDKDRTWWGQRHWRSWSAPEATPVLCCHSRYCLLFVVVVLEPAVHARDFQCEGKKEKPECKKKRKKKKRKHAPA